MPTDPPRTDPDSPTDDSVESENSSRFQRLAESVNQRRSHSKAGDERIWRSLKNATNNDNKDPWTELRESTPRNPQSTAETTETQGLAGTNTDIVGALSDTDKIIHGYVTVLVLGIAIVIYGSAIINVIPQHFWILSIPPLTIGLFLFAPIIARELDIWDPTQLS